MYAEDELIPLSAIQHMAFCPRQCALIHLEGLWADNRLTVEGQLLHEHIRSAAIEVRSDVIAVRDVPLRSLHLGVIGRADVVEFHRTAEAGAAITIPWADGLWRPFPVEYKRGRPKPDISDEAQLCAQAICLEEMLGVPIPEGAIFYGQPRRRYSVAFTSELRAQTEALAAGVHQLLSSGQTPPPHYSSKCRGCSMIDLCMPKAVEGRSVRKYLAAALRSATDSGEDE